MLRRLLLAGALVATLAGCGGDEDAAIPDGGPTGATTETPAPTEPVLASWSGPTDSELFWADPLTLEPVDARAVTVPFFFSVAERSPEGDLLAVGGTEQGSVQVVDPERMRARATIEVGAGGFVERLHWVRDDLLLASLGGLPSRVAALDPATGKVLSVVPLGGTVLYSQPAGDELVLLLAPQNRIGPARLAVFDGAEVRFAQLAEIRAGYESEGDTAEDFSTRQSIPGLAVDPEGGRALVVPAGNRVAEVDLATMEVAYHDLAEPVSLLGRLRDWLEPAAEAKALAGPARNAVWLPSGLVAVSGSQNTVDGEATSVTPAGLALVDPRDWSVQRVSDEPGWAAFRGDALLASAWKEGSDEQTLAVFDPEGRLRFTLVREGADLSHVSGGHLYAAGYDGTRFEIIDLATGRIVATAAPRRETFLVELDS